jgi:hypothetical protein
MTAFPSSMAPNPPSAQRVQGTAASAPAAKAALTTTSVSASVSLLFMIFHRQFLKFIAQRSIGIRT